jgi:hypothetical protein
LHFQTLQSDSVCVDRALRRLAQARVSGRHLAARKKCCFSDYDEWVKHIAEKYSVYDPAKDLLSDEGIAIFMADALETEDASYIAHALGVVAHAKDILSRAY